MSDPTTPTGDAARAIIDLIDEAHRLTEHSPDEGVQRAHDLLEQAWERLRTPPQPDAARSAMWSLVGDISNWLREEHGSHIADALDTDARELIDDAMKEAKP